jgi:hypothetical protein
MSENGMMTDSSESWMMVDSADIGTVHSSGNPHPDLSRNAPASSGGSTKPASAEQCANPSDLLGHAPSPASSVNSATLDSVGSSPTSVLPEGATTADSVRDRPLRDQSDSPTNSLGRAFTLIPGESHPTPGGVPPDVPGHAQSPESAQNGTMRDSGLGNGTSIDVSEKGPPFTRAATPPPPLRQSAPMYPTPADDPKPAAPPEMPPVHWPNTHPTKAPVHAEVEPLGTGLRRLPKEAPLRSH